MSLRRVLQRCMTEGLVGGEGFAIDASVVKADAARASAIPGAAIDHRALGPAQASRAVREYLDGIDADGRPETVRKTFQSQTPRQSGHALRAALLSLPIRQTT